MLLPRSRNATAIATAQFVIGLGFTYLLLPAEGPGRIFSTAAIGIGVSLLIATGLEGMSGIRSVIRADILMLWVLYGLTFLEFLFPQPSVDNVISTQSAVDGTVAAMLGFSGIALRSEEHTSELQSLTHVVCRLPLES